MEPQAKLLMGECADKNMIDKDEYPQTAELEMRCVSMLSTLRDVADLLIKDLKRQLPRLQRRPEPVHDRDSAGGFRH